MGIELIVIAINNAIVPQLTIKLKDVNYSYKLISSQNSLACIRLIKDIFFLKEHNPIFNNNTIPKRNFTTIH